MPPKLDRRSLSDQIKDTLIQDITTGALLPGDRLIELKIAEEMQTSQAPVREALRALHELGLVNVQRNKGTYVRALDTEELAQIYAVRAALESFSLRHIQCDPTELTDNLDRICGEIDAAISSGNNAAFVAGNDAFHRALARANENDVLLNSWDALDIRTRTALNVAQFPRDLRKAQSEHRAIVRAIADSEFLNASALLENHILSAIPNR